MNLEVKKESLEDIRRRLRAIGSDDEDDPRIDPGIIETLAIFNALNFYTWGSCEGHLPSVGEDIHPTDFNAGPYIELAPSDWADEMTDEEMAAREYRYENDEETPEDIARSEAQAREVRRMHRRMINLLEEFYANRSVLERYRLVVSVPRMEINGLVFASQGTWAEYSAEELPEFLEKSQAEVQAFTLFLHEKYFME